MPYRPCLASPARTGFSDYLDTVLPTSLLICDVFFWIDMLLTCATAVQLETISGTKVELLTRPKDVIRTYIKGSLFVDVVSGFPYYQYVCGEGGCIARGMRRASLDPFAVGISSYDAMVPLTCLLQVFRVRRIMRTKSERWLLLLDSHSDWRPLMRLVIMYGYLSHAAGCLFWYVSVYELEYGLSRSPPVVNWGLPQDFLPPVIFAGYSENYLNFVNITNPDAIVFPRSVWACYMCVHHLECLHMCSHGRVHMCTRHLSSYFHGWVHPCGSRP